MEVEWINGQHKEDDMIFDSDYEAYEWADSIVPELSGYLYSSQKNGGYMTRDIKVFNHLVHLVPLLAEEISKSGNLVKVNFNKEEVVINGHTFYKFWITH